jgi:hypothetical protein
MKRIILDMVTIFSLIAFLMVTSISVKSQGENDDTIVILGTQTFLPGETDPFEWECQGEFTNCTEVYIFG